jgi:hypothetical protein
VGAAAGCGHDERRHAAPSQSKLARFAAGLDLDQAAAFLVRTGSSCALDLSVSRMKGIQDRKDIGLQEGDQQFKRGQRDSHRRRRDGADPAGVACSEFSSRDGIKPHESMAKVVKAASRLVKKAREITTVHASRSASLARNPARPENGAGPLRRNCWTVNVRDGRRRDTIGNYTGCRRRP